MEEIEIRTMSAVGAANLLEKFGHIASGANMHEASLKLREVMSQELFWVGRSWVGHFELAYAGNGLWLRIEVPGRDGRMHYPVKVWPGTPNDGAGTEDYAPNH